MSLVKKMNSNFGLYKLEKAVLEVPENTKK
jgi:hypothetical protein